MESKRTRVPGARDAGMTAEFHFGKRMDAGGPSPLSVYWNL